MLEVVQHVDHVRAADRLRIVHACIGKVRLFSKLCRAGFGEFCHLRFRAEVQAAGRTSLDAGGLQSDTDSIRAQRALEDFLGRRIELRNVEGTSRNTILTTDAVLLIEIHNAVGVLDDCAVRRTRAQATGVSAVHALVFAHQPHLRSVFAFMLVELDEVPEIPLGSGHRLVGVVESGLPERMSVPLDTGYLAGLAADTGCYVYQLADFQLTLRAVARDSPDVA